MQEDFVPQVEIEAAIAFIEKVFFPKGTFTMDEIYSAEPGPAFPVIAEGISDHAMYVALSRLVRAGKIQGPDPYADVDEENADHTTMVYFTTIY